MPATDPDAFLRAGLKQYSSNRPAEVNYQNYYRSYACFQSVTRTRTLPIYFTTDRIEQRQETYRVVDFRIPVFLSDRFGLREVMTYVPHTSFGPLDRPTSFMGTLDRHYSHIVPGPRVVPAVAFGSSPGQIAPLVEPFVGPDPAPLEDVETVETPQTPPLSEEEAAFLQSGPYILYETQTLQRRMYRVVWAYDDIIIAHSNSKSYRIIYRLDPVATSATDDDVQILIGFQKGRLLERIRSDTCWFENTLLT
ncbi:MAG: hypothetical protein AAF231_05285 [Pseudomonadota bacterium]